jgi:hypothetical protein
MTSDALRADSSPEAERPRRYYVRPSPQVLIAFLPALAFILADKFVPTPGAIGTSFAVSAVIFVRNPGGGGVIRMLGAIGFAIVCGAAITGIALSSGKAYVAQNLFSDFAFAAIFAGSVLVHRPLMGAIIREVVPALKPVMPIDHRLFVQLTLANIAINLAQGTARVFLIQDLSASQYAIASRAISFPVSIAFYLLCYVLVHRTAIAIWPADMPPPRADGRAAEA